MYRFLVPYTINAAIKIKKLLPAICIEILQAPSDSERRETLRHLSSATKSFPICRITMGNEQDKNKPCQKLTLILVQMEEVLANRREKMEKGRKE